MRSSCLESRGIQDFDIPAFHEAFDAHRRAEGLTWTAVARHLSARVPRLPGYHAISPGTLAGMRAKGGVNGNIVMSALKWIGRSAESFMAGHPDATAVAPYPDDGILDPRWNSIMLFDAVSAKRDSLGATWRDVASDIGTTAGIIAAIGKGSAVGFPGCMRMTVWLERPAAEFVEEAHWNRR